MIQNYQIKIYVAAEQNPGIGKTLENFSQLRIFYQNPHGRQFLNISI